MELMGRRGMLKFFLAAGVTAVAGTALGRAEAAMQAQGVAAGKSLAGTGTTAGQAVDETGIVESFESAVEPTQSIVIRPGRRRRRVIIKPRPRRRPRLVCTRRRNGRLVCVRRF